jgi:MoxR-like ATPase
MEMNKVIVGQRHMIERLLIGLLQGHILLEGVPISKTLAINTLAQAVHGSFSRIQFTPFIAGRCCGDNDLQH